MLSSSLPLTDNSTGTPITITLVEVASPTLPNSQKLRRTIGNTLDYWQLLTSYTVSKGGVISAKYTTQRHKSSGGASQFAQVSTVYSRPGTLVTLADADLLSLMSAHGRFIDTQGSLTVSDDIVRLMNGEI